MSLRLPEPRSFEPWLEEVRVRADTLVRLSKFPKTEPYWSRGRYRFDGPPIGLPGSFGTCYAADDIAVAFCESVIHESAWFREGRYEIPLADLTGKTLKILGLNNDISAGSDYAASMAWAKAIHEADPKWDGIRYVSRQRNDRYAVALFERSGITRARTYKLAGKALDALCDEYHVTAI
jgi:hypothetical protein